MSGRPFSRSPIRRIALNVVLENPCSHYVVTDNREGGRLAARELLAAGYERFALVFPRTMYTMYTTEFTDRREGFLQALSEAGVASERIIETDLDLMAPESHLPAARRLAGCDRPLGVFCAFDRMAFALMPCLRELGMRIPEDVSIVGFDGDPEGVERTPTLATVEQDADTMAKKVLALVLAKDKPGPGMTRVAPRFRPGETLRPVGQDVE